MKIIVIHTGKFFKVLTCDDDRNAAAADHFLHLRRHFGAHQDDPGHLALLHDLHIAEFRIRIMFCTAQESHISLLKQCTRSSGCDLADRIGVQAGDDDPHLIDPSCAHGLGHRIGPVTGLFDRLSDTLPLFRAYGTTVEIPADCSRRNTCQPGNFFYGHVFFSHFKALHV